MKNPDDYIKNLIRPDTDKLIEIIKQAQIDAYNQAIDDVIEEYKIIDISVVPYDVQMDLDIPSILNLKK